MSVLLLVLYILFFTVVLLLYFLVPKKYRYIVLLTASLLFYAVYSKFMIIFILVTILTIYFAAMLMTSLDEKLAKKISEGAFEKDEKKSLKSKNKLKKKWIMVAGIVINIAILTILKYSGFIASLFEGILSWFKVYAKLPVCYLVLPLGISYYTLSSIGYMVDVYRGAYPAEKNMAKVALFVCYFPALFEGPFAKFNELSPQLSDGHEFDSTRIFSGFVLFLWGTIKKFVIADRFAIIASDVFKNYSEYSGIIVILGIVCFTIQLYAEFSGLIDMATGISEMFGIKLAKNFNQPFFSQNVNEFWRRWHISLGEWFKNYIFYPISMSKGMMKLNKKIHGKVKPFFEIFIPSLISLFFVWFLNGLWHGASIKYVVYGLYYYLIMMIGMCLEPASNHFMHKTHFNKDSKVLKWVRIVRTFILVNLGMLIFRATTLSDAGAMFVKIFTSGSFVFKTSINAYDLILIILGVISLITVDVLLENNINIRQKMVSLPYILKCLVLLIMIFIPIILGAYGWGYITPDPIYGGF